MFRYWRAHGKPGRLPILRESAAAEPVQIQRAGRDSLTLKGKSATLDRYTVANLAFGREIIWMDADGNLIAAMTFAGGLPLEAVRNDYEPALAAFYESGVAQEMMDLRKLAREVPPEEPAPTPLLERPL